MLIEAARRAEAAVKEMLAIANEGAATTDEFVDSLGISKSIAGINSAFQVAGAAAVADGNVTVMAERRCWRRVQGCHVGRPAAK